MRRTLSISTEPVHCKSSPTSRRRRASRPTRSRRLGIQLLEDRLPLTTLPTGFTETLIGSIGISSPTAMEFSPVGELFVLEQGGEATLVLSPTSTHTALSLTVDSSGERGLLGIAFDPDYDGTGPNTDYVYLYYTVPRESPTNPANNQLSRYEVTGAGTATPSFGSPTIIRDLPPEDEDGDPTTNGDDNHNGGAIHFGPDGKLYVAVGDHNYDAIGQGGHVSQILTTPFGKMLRLNPDGTNPSDTPNPFYTGSATDWEGAIWALGLRNPFTFAFEDGTGRMYINDVGEGVWEEINEGEAEANYGWAGSGAPVWEGFEPTAPWTNYRDPVMAYDHSGATPPSPGSVAITGGAFYPAGGPFGSTYAGKYFYADFGGSYIRVFDPANPGSSSTPDTSTAFASSLTAGLPVDLKVHADGSLYYLSRGSGGRVYRISANAVEGRHVFYNNSSFDGNNPAINTSDDGAIDPVRSAYLPGSGNAVDANITGYDKGINGIMVDLSGSGNHASITAADFVFKVGNNNSPDTWSAAPAPSDVQVRTGAGVSGADRVVITWADNDIEKEWLEVQVLANANTGLIDTFGGGIGDVFFWGNAVGDGDTGNTAVAAPVNATDEIGARNNPHSFGNPATVDDQYDYNKDTFVNATDQIISRNNSTNFATQLTKINIGTGGPFAPEGDDDPAGDSSGGTAGDAAPGDTGIASALAAAGDDSASKQSLPANVAVRLKSATSATASALDASLLLEAEAIDLADANVYLDDELLDVLAASLNESVPAV